MALAVTVTKHWDDGKILHVLGTITASGSYTTGGDTLSFANSKIKSASVPLFVNVVGSAGYIYSFVPGTTQATGKLKVFAAPGTAGPLAEISQAAYPSGVTGDTIQFNALFVKLQ